MGFFPGTKFVKSLIAVGVLLTLLKWGVDTCVPSVPSQIFPDFMRPPAIVCEPIQAWDVWSKTREARINSNRNFYNSGPNAFQSDDGSPSFFIFAKDFSDLTVLLGRVPSEISLLLELVMMGVFLSLVIAFIWEWGGALLTTPTGEHRDGYRAIRKRNVAIDNILPDYDNDRTSSGKPRKKR